jgi:hypothetical protein
VAAGTKIEGWKRVQGKKHRVWNNEDQAFTVLSQLGHGEEARVTVQPKMITPAAALKLVGKANQKHLLPLVTTPAGEPTLARDSDPRQALGGDFEAVTEDDLLGLDAPKAMYQALKGAKWPVAGALPAPVEDLLGDLNQEDDLCS